MLTAEPASKANQGDIAKYAGVEEDAEELAKSCDR